MFEYFEGGVNFHIDFISKYLKYINFSCNVI